jgi:hypothetical protein
MQEELIMDGIANGETWLATVTKPFETKEVIRGRGPRMQGRVWLFFSEVVQAYQAAKQEEWANACEFGVRLDSKILKVFRFVLLITRTWHKHARIRLDMLCCVSVHGATGGCWLPCCHF